MLHRGVRNFSSLLTFNKFRHWSVKLLHLLVLSRQALGEVNPAKGQVEQA